MYVTISLKIVMTWYFKNTMVLVSKQHCITAISRTFIIACYCVIFKKVASQKSILIQCHKQHQTEYFNEYQVCVSITWPKPSVDTFIVIITNIEDLSCGFIDINDQYLLLIWLKELLNAHYFTPVPTDAIHFTEGQTNDNITRMLFYISFILYYIVFPDFFFLMSIRWFFSINLNVINALISSI